jgi:hypothetical protein
LETGELAHYARLNDSPGLPWEGPTVFGARSSSRDSVTMIQSNFGDPGNLEVIAGEFNGLQFFFRDSGPGFKWNGPSNLVGFGGFSVPFLRSNPALIQSHFGTRGNFEVIAAETNLGDLPGSPIVHLFRNNDEPSLPWGQGSEFGGNQTDRIEAVTMIQSNFGTPGNLEVVARIGERLAFFFRDSGPGFIWNGPFFL